MMKTIVLHETLTWSEIAAIAKQQARLELSPVARTRLEAASAIVQAIVEQGVRGYGITTGVGALSDVAITREQQAMLSRNILMSHAAGMGTPLGVTETRAIMAAAINNFAHGYSGLRPVIVERLVLLLNADCTPEVPRQGSVGYISHMAQIGLLLIGYGHAVLNGERMTAGDALSRLELKPLTLEA